MADFTILYDEPQEAYWFRKLHKDFHSAKEESITSAKDRPSLKGVLAYDRPDIILLDGDTPILVVEETVEVPSGHNVGQRFARIAAAAESGIPFLYFGPYVARKHGGETEGPRYMNARLFWALDAMERSTNTAITTVNWPVDDACEVRRDLDKDADVREYMETFLECYYRLKNLDLVNSNLMRSEFHERMIAERNQFVRTQIKKPEQYDGPPNSVQFLALPDFEKMHTRSSVLQENHTEIILYNVGMKKIRSDPYTGMAMLYRYLYASEEPTRALVLWFPNISQDDWHTAASRGNRKDIRLFRIAADAVLFLDGLLVSSEL